MHLKSVVEKEFLFAGVLVHYILISPNGDTFHKIMWKLQVYEKQVSKAKDLKMSFEFLED